MKIRMDCSNCSNLMSSCFVIVFNFSKTNNCFNFYKSRNFHNFSNGTEDQKCFKVIAVEQTIPLGFKVNFKLHCMTEKMQLFKQNSFPKFG